MSRKAEALAARFEQASNDFAWKIQGLSDADWQAKTPEEGWTVAATASAARTRALLRSLIGKI